MRLGYEMQQVHWDLKKSTHTEKNFIFDTRYYQFRNTNNPLMATSHIQRQKIIKARSQPFGGLLWLASL